MKIAAIIDEFNECTPEQECFIQQVKTVSSCDCLILLMSGDFLQQGVPALDEKYIRAQQAVKVGADLVIELPVYCTLSSPDTYAYAAISTLEMLHCVDELYIACHTNDISILERIVQFLFIENKDYQKKLKAYRKKGLSFYQAEAKAVDEFIPGAGNILSSPVNLFATEYMRALKRIYSRIRPCFIQADSLSPLHVREETADNCPFISQLLYQELTDVSKNLDEIYGGTSMLTESIRETIDSYDHFNDFSARLQTPTRSHANIRRYMLNLLLHIRKADIAVARLYGFTLYFRILDASSRSFKAMEEIQKHTWTPLISDRIELPLSPETKREGSEKTFYQNLNGDAVQIMTSFDHRAHEIYLKNKEAST